MQDYNLEYRRFTMAKSIVSNAIYKDYAHFERRLNDLLDEIRTKKGLTDACLLLKMVKKECEAHNSRNSAERTRLEKIRYKDTKIYQSTLFKRYLKISTSKIDEAIKQNLQMDDYDIYRKFFELQIM